LNPLKNNQNGASQFFSENSNEDQSFDNKNFSFANQKRRISISNQDSQNKQVDLENQRENIFMGGEESQKKH